MSAQLVRSARPLLCQTGPPGTTTTARARTRARAACLTSMKRLEGRRIQQHAAGHTQRTALAPSCPLSSPTTSPSLRHPLSQTRNRPHRSYNHDYNHTRHFSITSTHNSSSARSWTPPPSPAPPALPKEEQRVFEELQKKSRGAFSTPGSIDDAEEEEEEEEESSSSTQQQPQSQPRPQSQTQHSPSLANSSSAATTATNTTTTSSSSSIHISVPTKTDPLHPDVRRGAPPEFEGDRNPTTGEIGGPKNNPLRWGHGGDWSYNGRVTDF